MIVLNVFQEIFLKKSVGSVCGEGAYYMQGVREVLQVQVWLASRPDDIMFRPENLVGMYRS